MIVSFVDRVTDLGPRNMVERRMEAGPDGLCFDRQMRNAFFDLGPAASTLTSRILGVRLHTEEPTDSHRVLIRLGMGAEAKEAEQRQVVVATSRFEIAEKDEAVELVAQMNRPEVLARANNVLEETQRIYAEVGGAALVGAPLAIGAAMLLSR